MRSMPGVGGYIAAGLFFHYGIGPWAGVFVAVAAAVAGGLDRRLSRLPLLAGRRLFRAAHHRLQRVHAHRLRSLGLGRRLGRPVPQGRRHHRHPQPARRTAALLLRDPGAGGRRLHPLPRPAGKPARPLLARHPRRPGSRAGGRRAGPALQDDRDRDLGGVDLARRCLERLLLQQPLPRDGLRDGPLDRVHPGADHRRAGHAVRPDRRRRAC